MLDRALDGVDAVCQQRMVGLSRELSDVVDYVRDNDLGTAALLAAVARHRGVERLVLASSMVVYGEGAYRCDEHGPVRPGPRPAARLQAGRFEPPCPRCGAELEPVAVTEDAPADPRSVYAATKLHQDTWPRPVPCQLFPNAEVIASVRELPSGSRRHRRPIPARRLGPSSIFNYSAGPLSAAPTASRPRIA